MTRQMIPTVTAHIDDGETLLVSSARYQDSLPFSGTFQVFDLDLCVQRKDDGRLFATVICAVDGDAEANEDSCIDIELLGDYQAVVGAYFDVIQRIAVV